MKGLDSWDVGDQVCMNRFEKNPLAWKKILNWSEWKEQFVKREAYSLLACLDWYDKKTEEEKFIELFPVISVPVDERNYLKKAVKWALRNIWKINLSLNKAAIAFAQEMQQSDSKAGRWVA